MMGPSVFSTVDSDGCSYYVLEDISDMEKAYLTLIEGLHEEEILQEDCYPASVRQAYYYVTCAIGIEDGEYLKDRKLPDLAQCLAVKGKWENTQVDSLAEINKRHGGSINGIYSINMRCL